MKRLLRIRGYRVGRQGAGSAASPARALPASGLPDSVLTTGPDEEEEEDEEESEIDAVQACSHYKMIPSRTPVSVLTLLRRSRRSKCH
nr:unnamed protein product [Spirometra erinaceieuropaei]